MVKHNNVIPNTHLRKHWQNRVRTWFNQPARKLRRLNHRRDRAAQAFPRPVDSLRPVVRCCTQKHNKRQRAGRGFTLEELKSAKLGAAFARSIGISVDHRRKNKSVESFQANVQRLLAYKERLVLFPRKDGQAKKGLVNDATAETIAKLGGQQNTERFVVAIPQAAKREKAQPVTQQLKDRKVYRELRQEWANAYYAGDKEKRAKEAEAK
jgi:large subunit ribosomal protein L13e